MISIKPSKLASKKDDSQKRKLTSLKMDLSELMKRQIIPKGNSRSFITGGLMPGLPGMLLEGKNFCYQLAHISD